MKRWRSWLLSTGHAAGGFDFWKLLSARTPCALPNAPANIRLGKPIPRFHASLVPEEKPAVSSSPIEPGPYRDRQNAFFEECFKRRATIALTLYFPWGMGMRFTMTANIAGPLSERAKPELGRGGFKHPQEIRAVIAARARRLMLVGERPYAVAPSVPIAATYYAAMKGLAHPLDHEDNGLSFCAPMIRRWMSAAASSEAESFPRCSGVATTVHCVSNSGSLSSYRRIV